MSSSSLHTISSSSSSSPSSVTRPDFLNFGPLVTRFTPPAACSALHAASGEEFGTLFPRFQQGRRCDGDDDLPNLKDCWPPFSDTTTNILFSASYNVQGYYSPGIQCPAGYTTACEASSYINTVFAFPPSAGETAIGCCPT